MVGAEVQDCQLLLLVTHSRMKTLIGFSPWVPSLLLCLPLFSSMFQAVSIFGLQIENETPLTAGEIELVCRSESVLIVKWSWERQPGKAGAGPLSQDLPPPLFTFFYRSIIQQNWTSQQIDGTIGVVKNLSSGGYVFKVIPIERFSGIEGTASMSKIFYTLPGNTELSKIEFAEVKPAKSFEDYFSAFYSWKPVQEMVCNYTITVWKINDQGFRIAPRISELYNTSLEHLEYSAEYKLGVNALHWDEWSYSSGPVHWMNYTSPSCGELNGYDYNFCGPDKPKASPAHINGCTIFLQWEPPPKPITTYKLYVLKVSHSAEFTISPEKTEYHLDITNKLKDMKGLVEIQLIAFAAGKESKPYFQQLRLPSSCPTHSGLWKWEPLAVMISLLLILMSLSAALIIFCLRCRQRLPSPSIIREDSEGYVEKIELGKSWNAGEIKCNMLTLEETVGKGEFGVVSRARLRLAENDKDIQVAVKSLHKFPTSEEMACFEYEVAMLKKVGKHKNLVSLVGYSMGEHLLVVEYCQLGDLQAFLRQTRSIRILLEEVAGTQRDCKDGTLKMVANFLYGKTDVEKKQMDLTTADLVKFAKEVAAGMEFLSKNKVIHRDLAARNVLLNSDFTAKISDFGLSRDVYLDPVYKKKHISKLPVKWMAPESLSHQIFTTQSDVWSYGILLWEMLTLGGSPYPSVPSESILKLLQTGYRMERPNNCTPSLYNLMKGCWRENPKERPTFSEILVLVSQELGELRSSSFIQLKVPFTESHHYD